MGKTRRDFIKISSVGAGGILAYSGSNFLPKKEEEERETLRYGIKRIPTYCEVCFWKCAGWVYFDEKGKMYSSVGFSNFVEKKMVSGPKELVFVIGGPYGFSKEVYQKATSKISLSQMTFSHQMVRLLCVEQIYRAFTIIKGEPYHHV